MEKIEKVASFTRDQEYAVWTLTLRLHVTDNVIDAAIKDEDASLELEDMLQDAAREAIFEAIADFRAEAEVITTALESAKESKR